MRESKRLSPIRAAIQKLRCLLQHSNGWPRNGMWATRGRTAQLSTIEEKAWGAKTSPGDMWSCWPPPEPRRSRWTW